MQPCRQQCMPGVPRAHDCAGGSRPASPAPTWRACVPPARCAPATRSVSAPPRLTTADDLFSFVARLRFVMEDPTQLLSGSVASYVLGQLALGKAPADVAVPGLTGVTCPPSAS